MSKTRKSSGYDAARLLREHSDYDRHVDIVSCWHSWYESRVPGCTFDRFPSRAVEDDHVVTPDFVVDFECGYVLVGEVSEVPNHSDGFKKSVMQAAKYTAIKGGADVVWIVPFNRAAEVEKRICDEGLLDGDESVVLLAYVCNTAIVNDRWEFSRPADLRTARFQDDFLGDELSNGIYLCDNRKTRGMGMEHCIRNKVKNPFINDPPPAIYCALYVYEQVAPLLFSSEDFLEGRLADEDPEPVTSSERLKDLCEQELGVRLHMDWIRAGLELLADAGIATRRGKDWVIHLKKRGITKSGTRDLKTQLAELVASLPSQPEVDSAQTVLAFE